MERSFLPPPEFERKANDFIQAVKTCIVPQYPRELLIVAENETSTFLQQLPGVIRRFKREGLPTEFCQKFSDRLDEESAFKCLVGIKITGEDKKLIERASGEIDKLASEYDGKKDLENRENGIILEEENNPWESYSIFLLYAFEG
jgi:hypothetical protein